MSADHEAALAELLAGLGDTPDAVADRLRALGIKGVQGDACFCPIARFLDSDSTPYRCAAVTDLSSIVDSPAEDYRTLQVSNPAPVAEFIGRFDAGIYLDLVQLEGADA